MTDVSFGKISEIDPDDQATWEGKIFLTFDIDWACDEIVQDSIEIIEAAGVSATWFVTHDTPLLRRLRSNPDFELGIHPNFNFLLDGDSRNGANATEVLDRLLNIVPEAKTIRSHCMTQSSTLLDLFRSQGLTHDSNHFIPAHVQPHLWPWKLWNGLVRVPYFWEDDIHCLYDDPMSLTHALGHTGLRVFDFHPIHVFLNTENMKRYEQTRILHRNPLGLIQHRNNELNGARNHLIQVLGVSV